MSVLSTSPERHTFQSECYIRRIKEEGKDTTDPEVVAMLAYYDSVKQETAKREASMEFSKNNMEYDLRTTQWMLHKVRSNEVYAQNLYAAMCNNDFKKLEYDDTPDNVVQVLRDGPIMWSCSWRYAGGIIADMREEGDYIDWYCSGINREYTEEELEDMTEEQRDRCHLVASFVSESVVTDEISADLLKLGWRVVPDQD